MITLPGTARKRSDISPPHPFPPFLQPFMGITVAWKGEMRHENLEGSGLWQVENSKDTTQLGWVTLIIPFHLSSPRD